MKLNYVYQDCEKWWAVVNTATNCCGSQYGGSCLNSEERLRYMGLVMVAEMYRTCGWDFVETRKEQTRPLLPFENC
jgi:hypothetical protein